MSVHKEFKSLVARVLSFRSKPDFAVQSKSSAAHGKNSTKRTSLYVVAVAGLLLTGLVASPAAADTVNCSGGGSFDVTGTTVSAGSTCVGWAVIPSGVEVIDASAFSGATTMTSVTIPGSITTIGDTAFSGATILASIIFAGNAPSTVGNTPFSGTASGAKAYIKSNATGFGTVTWEGLALTEAIDIATSSEIFNDDVGPTVVVTGVDFNASASLSDFTIDTTGTGLVAASVSVNAAATEASIAFTGTALTGSVAISTDSSAFAFATGVSSNTLAMSISSRILPDCPASATISVPCLESGTIARPNGSVGFRLYYSNNSGFSGSSFSLLAEIEVTSAVFDVTKNGDVATDLVILYPTSTAVGARLATATWAMASHKDFTYTKAIETVNGTEVVKLTTSYEYVDFVSKTGCGDGASMSFGDAPAAACESVGIPSDYFSSAAQSIDFYAATDMDWVVAETGADGGYVNSRASTFMWGSTADTPFRFQLIGPHYKDTSGTNLNSGSLQVYMPAALVTRVFGADFTIGNNLSVTREDSGVLTQTLSGTTAMVATQPNGGDLLINVPTHPFSAPVVTISSTSTPAPASYSGPWIGSPQMTAIAGSDLVLSGSKLTTINKLSIAGTTVSFLSISDTELRITVPAALMAGTYDLVVESSYGKLIIQSAIVVQSAIASDTPASTEDSAKPWTKKLDEASVKIYTKDLVGAGKVQFFFNGKEIAWVNATSADDPKLRTANGSQYLVRTVYLVEGQKNVLEVWVEGVRAWRAAYSY